MTEKEPIGYALIYGGKGALGSECVSYFKYRKWWVACVVAKKISAETTDSQINESSSQVKANNSEEQLNKEADINIIVDINASLQEQEQAVLDKLQTILGDKKLDAIVCAAGGFIAGNANDNLIMKADIMWRRNVWPSIISASVAVAYLNKGGLLCLSGSKTALNATPTNVAYGLAKSAIHQLTKSLANDNSGLPSLSVCLGLLPVTLDTVVNREMMPNADVSSWTPMKYITDLIYKWAIGLERPQNGSLVQFQTKNFNTDIIYL